MVWCHFIISHCLWSCFISHGMIPFYHITWLVIVFHITGNYIIYHITWYVICLFHIMRYDDITSHSLWSCIISHAMMSYCHVTWHVIIPLHVACDRVRNVQNIVCTLLTGQERTWPGVGRFVQASLHPSWILPGHSDGCQWFAPRQCEYCHSVVTSNTLTTITILYWVLYITQLSPVIH